MNRLQTARSACLLLLGAFLAAGLPTSHAAGATETSEPSVPAPAPPSEPPSFRDGRMVRGDARQRVLHFTFDDGPRPETTGPLLDHLDAAGVHATFFVVARQLGGSGARRERNVAMVRDTLRRGHQVGFHGLDHSAFSGLTGPQLDHQFRAGEAAFVRALGQRPYLVRPPYGRRNVDSDRVVVARHYTQVMWGITAADTSQTTARGVVEAFRSALRRRENGPRARGGVVLLHDTKPWVIEAFPALVAEVRARNCALLARGPSEELWDIAPDLTPFFEARRAGDHASLMTRNGGYAPAVQAARQTVLRAETVRHCAER
ncbi:MAG: polysaccharide deacetylase family protein [Sandaracinaceae bacterium]|nr:polysaccharide deacetylase family protein [Sandaracinaceae bacterium]